jgi:hypothetical protein
MILIGVALVVALIISSRNLGSFWSMVYKLVVGGIAGGVCLFVLQKVDTTDEIKWVCSFIVGLFVTIVAPAIPWL